MLTSLKLQAIKEWVSQAANLNDAAPFRFVLYVQIAEGSD